MARFFDIGDRPTVSGAFTDLAGEPAAPTAVTVSVLHPDGTEDGASSPDDSITLGETTTYTFPSPLDEPGLWIVRMRATEGVEAAGEIPFRVRMSPFTAP